jgi:hypothetical protein
MANPSLAVPITLILATVLAATTVSLTIVRAIAAPAAGLLGAPPGDVGLAFANLAAGGAFVFVAAVVLGMF